MEKPSRALPIILAIVIALAGFTLVLAAIARFMPSILQFAGSRWGNLVVILAFLLTTFLTTLTMWRGARRKARV